MAYHSRQMSAADQSQMSATNDPYQGLGWPSSGLMELAPYVNVRRVIIVGPGAAGKSTQAVCLGEITGLPLIELYKIFWMLSPAALSPASGRRPSASSPAKSSGSWTGTSGPMTSSMSGFRLAIN